MTQDDKWEQHYEEVKQYLLTHKKRPSKYLLEEHNMLNWIKYNKKRSAKGKLPELRAKRFSELCKLAESYTRINQHAYKNTVTEELSLF